MMNLKIVRASNGLHVQEKENEWNAIYLDTIEGKQEFLFDLLDVLGWQGSRHDAERIYIRIEPGDKYISTETLEENRNDIQENNAAEQQPCA
jgi:hypothetical protein